MCSESGVPWLDVLQFGELILLFLVWLFAPLLPAVAIYKRFPNTEAFVSGPLKGLTFKAGGAFAAYVITLLIFMSLQTYGKELISNSAREISANCKPGWKVVGQIEFRDEDDNVKPDFGKIFLKQLVVETDPELYFHHGLSPVDVRIPAANPEELPKIAFKVNEFFTSAPIDLGQLYEKIKSDQELNYKLNHKNDNIDAWQHLKQYFAEYFSSEGKIIESDGMKIDYIHKTFDLGKLIVRDNQKPANYGNKSAVEQLIKPQN